MSTLKEEWMKAMVDWRFWALMLFLGYALYCGFGK